MKPVFHAGEIAVQKRAGVQDLANRVGRSIDSVIPLQAEGFLRSQPMAIIGSLDAHEQVWASVLAGQPGFIQALDEKTLVINAHPLPEDPLHANLAADSHIGVLVLEPMTRRRMRLNGKAEVKDGMIVLHAEEVFFNCPKYIQARAWKPKSSAAASSQNAENDSSLNARQQRWIAGADTFFIASNHSERGVDASHRGGNPGFVQVVNGNVLRWPDYKGNNMFQTLGNLSVNPNAGLLFLDFETGATLQLTGKAEVLWEDEEKESFSGAERVVEFKVDRVVEVGNAVKLDWLFLNYSPFNSG